MSDKETKAQADNEKDILEKVQGFWGKHSKSVLYGLAAFIIIVGGYWGYTYFVQLPKEKKAQEEIYKAEANFRKDSLQLALNGNPVIPGFLKIINKYEGTKAGNLAKLYAGACYLQLGDFKNAIKQLEDVDVNGAKQIEAKVEGMLGDAYSENKQNEAAIEHYRKAGTIFPDDALLSSEYLFRAGLLLEMSGKNKEAIEVYREIKEKYPRTEKGFTIDKYLARLGENK